MHLFDMSRKDDFISEYLLANQRHAIISISAGLLVIEHWRK